MARDNRPSATGVGSRRDRHNRTIVRRCLTVVVLLFAATALDSGQPAARDPGERYGVVTYYLSPFLARSSAALGTRWVRIVIDWDALQPDGPDQWNDRDLREWLESARANGLHVYATLIGTPAWAGPCRGCMPDENASWQAFVHRVLAEIAADYATVDVVYGIWNEPNLTGPRGFFMGDEADYVTLFGLADLARRSANPAARLAGPELSSGGRDPRGYLAAVMNRLRPHMRRNDIVAVHWYPGDGSLAEWMRAAATAGLGHEIWLTETGASSCNDAQQRTWMDYVLNTFDFGSPSPWWTKIFWYYLYDAATDCASNLIRPDGSLRPAAVDYQNRARRQTARVQPVALRSPSGGPLRDWTALDLADLDGGSLRDGDAIALRLSSGLYVQADQGGGGRVPERGFAPFAWETFVLMDLDRPGGAVLDGDRVALRTSGGFYLSAEGGTGPEVNARARTAGAWERFIFGVR